jgi:hypothetical protein
VAGPASERQSPRLAAAAAATPTPESAAVAVMQERLARLRESAPEPSRGLRPSQRPAAKRRPRPAGGCGTAGAATAGVWQPQALPLPPAIAVGACRAPAPRLPLRPVRPHSMLGAIGSSDLLFHIQEHEQPPK